MANITRFWLFIWFVVYEQYLGRAMHNSACVYVFCTFLNVFKVFLLFLTLDVMQIHFCELILDSRYCYFCPRWPDAQECVKKQFIVSPFVTSYATTQGLLIRQLLIPRELCLVRACTHQFKLSISNSLIGDWDQKYDLTS